MPRASSALDLLNFARISAVKLLRIVGHDLVASTWSLARLLAQEIAHHIRLPFLFTLLRFDFLVSLCLALALFPLFYRAQQFEFTLFASFDQGSVALFKA